jgi:hypothetical protein
MKKNLFKKSFLKSILSTFILISVIICALGCFEELIFGLFNFRSLEEMPDGQTKEIDDCFYTRRETTGFRKDGKWDGGIEIVRTDKDAIVKSIETGYYLDGKRTGKFVTKYYNDKGEVTETYIDCYFLDIAGPCGKSATIENESAYDILINKYPYFYRDLKAFHFENGHVKSYIDSIGSIIDTKEYSVSDFDDNYDDAVDNLKTGIYDSLWIMHDRLALLNGLDDIKDSQLRMAVIDHHRNLGIKTFNILKNSYPNYLKEVNNEGVGNTDFEVFCGILDSIMATYSPLNINNHFFPDSIDVRLYRALDMIYSDEYKASPGNSPSKSSVVYSPKLLKEMREAYKNMSEKNPVAASPKDVAGLVGMLMQEFYNHADKVRLALEEVYLKKGSVIDYPKIGTIIRDTVSTTSVNINGYILDNGGGEITEKGIAWATFYNPTINDNNNAAGTGLAEFTVKFDKLETGKTYYFRAYARNSAGVAYGNSVSFKAGVTGISQIADSKLIQTLYPNPFSESATLEFTLSRRAIVSLSVFDMQGKLLMKKEIGQCQPGTNRYLLYREGLVQGMYYYKLETSTGEIGSGKVIIRD